MLPFSFERFEHYSNSFRADHPPPSFRDTFSTNNKHHCWMMSTLSRLWYIRWRVFDCNLEKDEWHKDREFPASNLGFPFWILSHSFGENKAVRQNLEWKAWFFSKAARQNPEWKAWFFSKVARQNPEWKAWFFSKAVRQNLEWITWVWGYGFNSTQLHTSYCSINAMFPERDFPNVFLWEHNFFVLEAQPFIQVTVSKNKAAVFINEYGHFRFELEQKQGTLTEYTVLSDNNAHAAWQTDRKTKVACNLGSQTWNPCWKVFASSQFNISLSA